jgi:hypothetical protein
LRHSFASYWLPVHHSLDKLLVMMGHSGGTSTFSRHYHAGVPRVEAMKYWRILPAKRKSAKIVEFKAA